MPKQKTAIPLEYPLDIDSASYPQAMATFVDANQYKIANDGVQASIFAEPTYSVKSQANGVCLTVNGSFGNLSHEWKSIGVDDWRDFLIQRGKDEVLKGLYGDGYQAFDARMTLRAMISSIDSHDAGSKGEMNRLMVKAAMMGMLMTGVVDKRMSQDGLLKRICDATGGQKESIEELMRASVQYSTTEEAEGFWTHIWPVFISAIHIERESEQEFEMPDAAVGAPHPEIRARERAA